MHRFGMLAAVAAALMAGSSAAAQEKPQQPKQRKICRTVEMPGRITPKRICRPRAERPGSEDSDKPAASKADEAADRRD
jgi:hypothetical protein